MGNVWSWFFSDFGRTWPQWNQSKRGAKRVSSGTADRQFSEVHEAVYEPYVEGMFGLALFEGARKSATVFFRS